jgi:hypothetical protein
MINFCGCCYSDIGFLVSTAAIPQLPPFFLVDPSVCSVFSTVPLRRLTYFHRLD